MIYRAAQLEEIVDDLMEAVEAERLKGEEADAAAARAARENQHLRSTLCAILAATQQLDISEDSVTRMQEIEAMIEGALATRTLRV